MPGKPEFLQTADSIGSKLCRDAIWAGDRCNWLGWATESVGPSMINCYRAQGTSLYDGTSGIALFLAQLYSFTKDPIQRATAEAALRQARSGKGPAQPVDLQQSLFSGKTGIAHAMLEIADHLGDEQVRNDGLEELAKVAAIPPYAGQVDIITGCAGIIQVLTAAGTRFRRDDLVAGAVRHGQHLLASAIRGDAGWCWETIQIPGQKPLLGYAHGASGIACALLELHRATGDKDFRHAADEAFRYERAYFNPTACNWPDLRLIAAQPNGQLTYPMAWCHGAPGIALSRLRSYQLDPTSPEIAREIQAALQTTINSFATARSPAGFNFSLCHGAAGNADPLIIGAGILGDPGLMMEAEKVAWMGIQHYQSSFSPWPCGALGAGETPNLMLGLAGIGHFYLRIYSPDTVPSILMITPKADAQGAGK